MINRPILVGYDVNQAVFLVELNLSRSESKESEVSSQSYILTRMIFGSALAENDISSQYGFATEFFDSKSLTVAVSAVFGSTLSFFMCHDAISFGLLQVNGLDFDN